MLKDIFPQLLQGEKAPVEENVWEISRFCVEPDQTADERRNARVVLPVQAKARIAIIGAGMSGLCMAMKLQQQGRHDFVMLEQQPGLGGTWWDNTYPGASCDAPSYLYSFSFAQKTDWSRRFAWQPELLGYSVECAIRSGLLPHMRFRAEVTTASYDTARAVWRIEPSPKNSRFTW